MDSEVIRSFLISLFSCRIALIFICGSFFGSFINCVAQRIVKQEDWIFSRSHCDHCGHDLGLFDLIPVLSFAVHKGRCRYCHEKLSVRYVLTEIMCGIFFVLVYLHHPYMDMLLVRDLILTVILAGLSLVDLDTYRIPDGFIVTGVISWIVSVFFAIDNEYYVLKGIKGAFVIAGLIWILMMVMDHVLHKESMGMGDIKLLFMLGLYSGVYMGIWILLFSSLFGILMVIIFRKRMIPFGPCLAMAGFLILLMT